MNKLIRITRQWAGRCAELFCAACLLFTALLILISLWNRYP